MAVVDVEGVLVGEHQRAFRLAYLLCGDAAAAEDIAAECLARVWARSRSAEISDPGAYLRRAVVNEVTSRFRRRHHERRMGALLRPDATVDDGTAASADRAHLRSALNQLPPRQRAAVVLRYYEDLSEADIAAAMHTSVGTTKAHVSRGLAALRALIDEREAE